MSNNNVSSNNKRIAKNTVLLYVRLVFTLLVSFYTTRVVLNVLGEEDYGINNVVAGFVSMFAFLNTSMSNGIQRFFNYERALGGAEAAKRVYNHALVIQAIVAFVIVILTETIGLWYLNNKMVIPTDRLYAAEWIFHFSVLSLVLVIFTVPYTAAVMSHEKMGYFAFVSIFEAVFKLVFVILLQFISLDKLIFYGFLQVCISLTSFVLYYTYSRAHFEEIRIKLVIRRNMLLKMVSFSGWNLLGTFAYTIKGQGLNLLLNSFFGPIVNAARGISFQVLNALQGFSHNLFISFRPQVVEAYAKGNYDRVRNLIYSMSKLSFYLFYLFVIPIVLEIEYVLRLWLCNNIPEYTIPFSILILFNTMVGNFNTPVTMVIHAIGKLKTYQCVTATAIVLILPISFFFLQAGGSPLVVYWVSLAMVVINQILCLIVIRTLFDFRIRTYSKQVLLPSLFVFVIAPILPIVVHVLLDESFFRLVVVSIVSVVSLCVSVYSFGLNKNEKSIFLAFLSRLITKK